MVRIPTLKSILRVEKVLREAKVPLTKEKIKSRLPAKMPHSTLNLILDYLKASRKIVQTQSGISWVFDGGKQEKKIIEELEKRMEL
ncbi:MAG: hypothetical protein OEY22_07220 [Candidatus Bathyarchaeota archaeon]|nr:hypothetical protein [Candidatus Bathyarchaeota archaeon]MDH5788300.1 hypothetical protein [Candidatus Bathyarchaeota archaeon]